MLLPAPVVQRGGRPTELPRQRSRQADKVFVVPNGGGRPADVYHFEVQVKRTENFEERMVSYWASLAHDGNLARIVAGATLAELRS